VDAKINGVTVSAQAGTFLWLQIHAPELRKARFYLELIHASVRRALSSDFFAATSDSKVGSVMAKR